MATVAVTPPYDPGRWLHRASPLLLKELEFMVDEDSLQETGEMIADFSLKEAAVTGRQPMLIFGGGRDVIVPPNESQLLAERVGERGTLVWYPEGGHCLYEFTDRWMMESAVWIRAIDDAHRDTGVANDPLKLASIGRNALEAVHYEVKQDAVGFDQGEEFTEYARLLPTDRKPEDS